MAYAAQRKELDDEFKLFQSEARDSVEKNGYYSVDEPRTRLWSMKSWPRWCIIFGYWDYNDPKSVEFLWSDGRQLRRRDSTAILYSSSSLAKQYYCYQLVLYLPVLSMTIYG
uniref:Uncharacterized protein n=1 Tax=Oryza brachyantha TaxID=4533 RepID=J3L1B5_ORYBR